MGIRHDRPVQGHAARSSEILPWAHTIFGTQEVAARNVPRVSGKHLPRYLDEFVYRFDAAGGKRALRLRAQTRRARRAMPTPTGG